jgi:hypothetical protein
MITWEWTKQSVEPDDIIDAIRAMPPAGSRHTLQLVPHWTPALTYLDWAKSALLRGGDDGWDAAAGWAKRAVCRQMDCILVHNHLSCFLGRNYKDKAGYLSALRVPGLPALRELVIDPRNDIEHSYARATEAHARMACDIAELFLGATDKEANIPAVVDLGWNFEYAGCVMGTPTRPYHFVEIKLTKEHGPMLVVTGYPDAPEAVVLYPQDETLSVCSLKHFSSEQVLALNDKLREPLRTGSYSLCSVSTFFMKALKEQLRL